MQRKMTKAVTQGTTINPSVKYISPKDLAVRWGCARSSVDRYCKAEGLHRLLLGRGKNACVRYLWSEVEALERKRTVSHY
jgi:hypothetical protein